MYAKEITIQVKRGTKVNVQEVDAPADSDPRMKGDRDAHVILPEDLKVAIKRVAPGKGGAAANVVTMCG